MIYAFLLVSCIVFIELFMVLDLRKDASRIIAGSREAMRVIMSPEADDDEKEAFVRRASADMFVATFKFLLKFLIIFLALYALYALVSYIVPAIRGPILESLVSPIVIVGLTLLAMAYVWLRNVILK